MNKVFYIIIILTAFLLLLSCSVRRNIPYKTYDFSEQKESVFWAGAPYRFNERPKNFLYVLRSDLDEKCSMKPASYIIDIIVEKYKVKCKEEKAYYKGILFFRKNSFSMATADLAHSPLSRITAYYLEKNFIPLYCFPRKRESSYCGCIYYGYFPEGEEYFLKEFEEHFFCPDYEKLDM